MCCHHCIEIARITGQRATLESEIVQRWNEPALLEVLAQRDKQLENEQFAYEDESCTCPDWDGFH